MIVYGSPLSPFFRKVAVCMAEKGLALEFVPAGLGRGGPDFVEASPFGKIPALRDPGADAGKDFCVSDSSAIFTYLEAKQPEPSLLPSDPVARARAIWFEEFGDTILFPVAAKAFFNRFVAPKVLKVAGDEAVAATAMETELPPLLDYIEGVIPPSGYLVADRFTIADIAVASPLANLAYVGVAIDPARWPILVAWLERILARPSFATSIATEQQIVARFS